MNLPKNRILRTITCVLAGAVIYLLAFVAYNLSFDYSKITKIEMSHETSIDRGKVVKYTWSIGKEKLTPVFKSLVPDYDYSFKLTFGHMTGIYYINDQKKTFSFYSPKSGAQITYFRFGNAFLPSYRYKLEGESVELFHKLMNENKKTIE